MAFSARVATSDRLPHQQAPQDRTLYITHCSEYSQGLGKTGPYISLTVRSTRKGWASILPPRLPPMVFNWARIRQECVHTAPFFTQYALNTMCLRPRHFLSVA